MNWSEEKFQTEPDCWKSGTMADRRKVLESCPLSPLGPSTPCSSTKITSLLPASLDHTLNLAIVTYPPGFNLEAAFGGNIFSVPQHWLAVPMFGQQELFF